VSQLLDVTFGDAEELMVAWLRSRALVADSDGAVTVDVDAPSMSLAGTTRYVQVELAGSSRTRVVEFATLRFVAWAPKGKRHDVKALASQVGSQLLLHPGDGDVGGVSPLVGRSSVAVDPDTKNLSCWGTVRVGLLPHQAS
jgi:hypothetical protein